MEEKGGGHTNAGLSYYSESAENSPWYWVQAETRMDHSGAKKKVSCTKDSTQASASTGLCLHAYLHHKFQYISDLRDRQTRGSSSGKFHLSSPKTEYYKQLFEYSTVKLWNILLPSIRMLNAPVPFVKACQYWVKWRIILYFLFVLYCLSCLRCTYIVIYYL